MWTRRGHCSELQSFNWTCEVSRVLTDPLHSPSSALWMATDAVVSNGVQGRTEQPGLGTTSHSKNADGSSTVPNGPGSLAQKENPDAVVSNGVQGRTEQPGLGTTSHSKNADGSSTVPNGPGSLAQKENPVWPGQIPPATFV
ncbi:hypothetical protein H920_00408 [Fukomys damarensis]|uniref:Uncharacterized protein n=1 Tax=Fukomys damarensis TaxID=885580 RepID=A0A091E6G0_FUKDA|nr:hypothetical protein H920_00408 [Fukomys damarensis]